MGPRSLAQHLDACAEQWPDRPFVIFEDQVSSYAAPGQFEEQVAARRAAGEVANELQEPTAAAA